MNETDGLRYRRLNRPQIITDEPQEPEYKATSTYSGRVFRVTLLTLAAFLLLPLLGAILLLESPIQPQYLSFSEPPLMSGCLEPNFKLRQAERLFEGQLVGPESIANIGDVLYTGTADGKILKIQDGNMHILATLGQPPCGTRDDEPTCGRPLGIRVGPNGTLFVADAYLGLFEVNPVTGAVDVLVSTKNPVAGRRLSFVNDLDVTQDGRKIYFTDSSSKWQRRDFSYLIMEGTDDGRLLEYDTLTRDVTVLIDGLRFPNGVQLSPAEDFVLVAETTMARIRRCHVSGLQKGGMDTFVENLPGFPDNIRRSSSGGYWVAMSAVRPNPGFSMLDFLAEKPWIKNIIFKLLSQEVLMKFVPKYSLVVELSENAVCERSFHDPHGTVATYVSEAHEHDGHLYLGSFRSPFLCRLDLSQV
ncbi:adipocyte plasma membrane-associated protein [Amia ocellicauda]|uniref:adipocyte plasma membrane-associated protein n=1 Tax=Amia ocellicauda TaxID=2972642 RepID=UPI003463C3D7